MCWIMFPFCLGYLETQIQIGYLVIELYQPLWFICLLTSFLLKTEFFILFSKQISQKAFFFSKPSQNLIKTKNKLKYIWMMK